MSSSQLSPDSARKSNNIDSQLSKLVITGDNTSNDAKDDASPGTAKTYRWADEMDDTDSSLEKKSEEVERSHSSHVVRISNLIKNTTAAQIKEVLPRELIIQHITFENNDHTSALVSFKQDIHMLKALQHSGKILSPNYSRARHSDKEVYIFIDPWEDSNKQQTVKNNLKHSSSAQSLPRSKTTSNYSPLNRYHTDDFSRHNRRDRHDRNDRHDRYDRHDRSERSDFSRSDKSEKSDFSRSEALASSDRNEKRMDFRTVRNTTKEEPKQTLTERPKLILKARTKPLNTEFTNTLPKINEVPLASTTAKSSKEPSEYSRPTSPSNSSKKTTQRSQDLPTNTSRGSRDLSKSSFDKESHISRSDTSEKTDRRERTGRRDRIPRHYQRNEKSSRPEKNENTVSTATQTDLDLATKPPQKDKSGSFSKTSSPQSTHSGNKLNNSPPHNKYNRKRSDLSSNKSYGNKDNKSTGRTNRPPT